MKGGGNRGYNILSWHGLLNALDTDAGEAVAGPPFASWWHQITTLQTVWCTQHLNVEKGKNPKALKEERFFHRAKLSWGKPSGMRAHTP